MSNHNYVAMATRLAKTLFAGFALAVVTVVGIVGIAIAFGWQRSLAELVTSPWLTALVLLATLLWSWIVRNRLS